MRNEPESSYTETHRDITQRHTEELQLRMIFQKHVRLKFLCVSPV